MSPFKQPLTLAFAMFLLSLCTQVQAQIVPIVSDDSNKTDQVDSHENKDATFISVKKVKTNFDEFPIGMTSFGATVVDNKIYVIGGKSGRAHSYAKSYQNRDVYCLNLDGSNNKWQKAGENLGLQGLAIVGRTWKMETPDSFRIPHWITFRIPTSH